MVIKFPWFQMVDLGLVLGKPFGIPRTPQDAEQVIQYAAEFVARLGRVQPLRDGLRMRQSDDPLADMRALASVR